MPRAVDRQQVQDLLRTGAQLLDVLPEDDFTAVHIPGAINLPLKQLTRETAATLDRGRPVICYCYDYQ